MKEAKDTFGKQAQTLMSTEKTWNHRRQYALGRSFVTLAARLLFKVDIKGKQNMPYGPKIFVANHPTTMDPGLLTLVSPEPMRMLIKDLLFKVPVLGPYLAHAGHIPVTPGQGKQALDTACEHLQTGGNIGIFIEGTLSPFTAGNHTPRTGTLRMALRAGVPLIPVGIYLDRSRIHNINTTVDGEQERSRWAFSGPYAMTIGQPLQLTGDVNNWDLVKRHSSYVMHHVMELAYLSQERALRRQVRRMHFLTGHAHMRHSRFNLGGRLLNNTLTG